MPVSATTTKLTNSESDRIFLVDNGCVVQCLHETQLTQPLIHTPPPVPEEDLKLAPAEPGGKPAKEAAPSADEAPGEVPEEPAADGGNPFEAPADDGDNPFGTP